MNMKRRSALDKEVRPARFVGKDGKPVIKNEEPLTVEARKNGYKNIGKGRIYINPEVFESMCFAWCTEEEIAVYFGCSTETLCKWCKRTYGKNFAEVFKELRTAGNVSLRRLARLRAETNDIMLIFMCKNYLGMCDDPKKYEKNASLEDKMGKYFDALTDQLTDDSDDSDDSDKTNSTSDTGDTGEKA
jgi:AraC-like DNA-binding protein